MKLKRTLLEAVDSDIYSKYATRISLLNVDSEENNDIFTNIVSDERLSEQEKNRLIKFLNDTWEDLNSKKIARGIYEDASHEDKIEEIDELIDDLYKLRQESILTDGEYGKGNLIFKELRNRGILDDLKDLKVELENEDMSLNELLREDSTDELSYDQDKIIDEFNKETNNFYSVYFSKPDRTFFVEIESGDWKHDHLFAKLKMRDILADYGLKFYEGEEVTDEDGSDSYGAIHSFEIVDDSFDDIIIESLENPREIEAEKSINQEFESDVLDINGNSLESMKAWLETQPEYMQDYYKDHKEIAKWDFNNQYSLAYGEPKDEKAFDIELNNHELFESVLHEDDEYEKLIGKLRTLSKLVFDGDNVCVDDNSNFDIAISNLGVDSYDSSNGNNYYKVEDILDKAIENKSWDSLLYIANRHKYNHRGAYNSIAQVLSMLDAYEDNNLSPVGDNVRPVGKQYVDKNAYNSRREAYLKKHIICDSDTDDVIKEKLLKTYGYSRKNSYSNIIYCIEVGNRPRLKEFDLMLNNIYVDGISTDLDRSDSIPVICVSLNGEKSTDWLNKKSGSAQYRLGGSPISYVDGYSIGSVAVQSYSYDGGDVRAYIGKDDVASKLLTLIKTITDAQLQCINEFSLEIIPAGIYDGKEYPYHTIFTDIGEFSLDFSRGSSYFYTSLPISDIAQFYIFNKLSKLLDEDVFNAIKCCVATAFVYDDSFGIYIQREFKDHLKKLD